MRSNVIEEIKKTLKLNKEQRDIITGLMLGDGCLETQNRGQTYRLKVEQSEKHKEYLLWLWKIFKDWTRTAPSLKIKTRPSGTIVKTFYFNTYSHSAFRFYAHQFYSKEGKKKIPKIIKKLLTPLSLAVWFMDDGSWKSDNHRTYIFHVDGYSRFDLLKIQQVLKEKFKIEIFLHRQYENWRIYVKTESAETFRNLIKKHIIASMTYKLGNTLPKE
ncbi:MAG: hypothetical protein HYW34_03410 [Candidatus Brennerbacteria bacterium]|nr:hypothetical protein [Candidatus Brennerbacteria bacterium]